MGFTAEEIIDYWYSHEISKQWFAERHRGLIRRFGRFPHRNEILGRTSTLGEIERLNSGKAFTG
jgi:uncharacterized protein (DUF924 family)